MFFISEERTKTIQNKPFKISVMTGGGGMAGEEGTKEQVLASRVETNTG